MFVAGNGLVEAFAIGEAAEVEGAAPAVFVDVGGEVVVAIKLMLVAAEMNGRWRTHCLVNVAYSALRAWKESQYCGICFLPIKDSHL